ncbi:hypothetical protein RFI_14754 [Reticulomyxa filosa]|uniref:Major facilitator superfamily (MFS) profile domain-containing protein n=1 Tax=Reticulomyxa filosa TaxID=46433 RepID=X6N8U3_RETFI|nr:hypothetical protein RFI_14754 [Reticulomyxa filosa]|eukprot:ETO22446.1 hypothetical protein RFI_14754 [Reticulomyxa filosa]
MSNHVNKKQKVLNEEISSSDESSTSHSSSQLGATVKVQAEGTKEKEEQVVALTRFQKKMQHLQVQSFSFLSEVSSSKQASKKYQMWCVAMYFVATNAFIVAAPSRASLSMISWLFSLRAFGYVVGSVTSGYLLDAYPRHGHNLICITALIGGGTSMATPYIRNLWLLITNFCFQGVCFSFVDCICNVCLLALFRKSQETNLNASANAAKDSDSDSDSDSEGRPYMQALHFFFAFGALLSPLAIQLSLDLIGSYELSSWIFGLLCVPVAIVLFLLPCPVKEKNQLQEQHLESPVSTSTPIQPVNSQPQSQHTSQVEIKDTPASNDLTRTHSTASSSLKTTNKCAQWSIICGCGSLLG